MSVAVGRGTVGCPAGVTDSDVSGRQRLGVNLGNQIVEFSGLLAGLKATAGGNDRDSCGIVSAVFETTKST